MLEEIVRSLAARTGGRCRIAVAAASQGGAQAFFSALARACGGEAEEGSMRAPLPEGGELTAFLGEGECEAAVLVTADASCGVPREEIAAEEEKLAARLSARGVPAVLALCSRSPASDECAALAAALEKKYALAAVACGTDEVDAPALFSALLLSFPLTRLEIFLPAWMQALPQESKAAEAILAKVREAAAKMRAFGDLHLLSEAFEGEDVYCLSFEGDAACGSAVFRFAAKEGVFYRTLSQECGEEIGSDLQLLAYIRSLARAKRFYDGCAAAFAAADECGYGVTPPAQLTLRAPETVRRGGKCGVRLCADAVQYHVIRVCVRSDISPYTGEGERGEEFARSMAERYRQDPDGLWDTDMFGKSFRQMAQEEMQRKTMPPEARGKLQRAVERIVNEGRGGVLCILL